MHSLRRLKTSIRTRPPICMRAVAMSLIKFQARVPISSVCIAVAVVSVAVSLSVGVVFVPVAIEAMYLVVLLLLFLKQAGLGLSALVIGVRNHLYQVRNWRKRAEARTLFANSGGGSAPDENRQVRFRRSVRA